MKCAERLKFIVPEGRAVPLMAETSSRLAGRSGSVLYTKKGNATAEIAIRIGRMLR